MQGQAKDWTIPETNPDSQGSQTHPDKDDDREIWRFKFGLAPGSILEGRALYLPSGETQDHPSFWEGTGASGAIEWALTWDNGGSNDTSTHEIDLDPSLLQYGKQPGGINGVWPSIRHGYLPFALPNMSWHNSAEWVKWSEWTTVTAILSHRGGVRMIHCALNEVPRLYVSKHDNSAAASAHVYPPPAVHPDDTPQTDQDDGATYEEHRFGTTKTALVQQRQSEQLGPKIFSWSAFLEGDGDAGTGGNPGSVATADYPPNAVSNSTTTKQCLWDTSITAWSAAAPGFAVPSAYALRFKENDPEYLLKGRHEAVIPVRLNLYGAMAAGTGYVYLQTSSRSQLKWEVTGASDAFHTFTGFVECQARPDDTGTINGMIFIEGDGTNACTGLYCDVQFGEFAES